MTKAEKQQLVAELTDGFKDAGAIVVCDYKGMGVKDIESVRKMARDTDAKVKIVKNTLASIALANTEHEKLDFVDMNMVIWGNDQIATCKIADKTASDFKEKFAIRSALLEGKAVDVNTVISMAKLPGREELLGMLLNVWMAPIRNITIGLDRLATKKQEEA